MSLRQEAAESKADASNLRNRAIRQDAHAALCISDAEALEKAAAVLDKTRSS